MGRINNLFKKSEVLNKFFVAFTSVDFELSLWDDLFVFVESLILFLSLCFFLLYFFQLSFCEFLLNFLFLLFSLLAFSTSCDKIVTLVRKGRNPFEGIWNKRPTDKYFFCSTLFLIVWQVQGNMWWLFEVPAQVNLLDP